MSDLIDIDCIDQWLEIDETRFVHRNILIFTDLIDLYRKTISSFKKTEFMQTVYVLTIELQLRVEGSNNYLFFQKS